MPKKTKPTTRRRPLKRQRLGGVTVTIQRDGQAFMVAVHHPDGKRSRTRCATKGEAETEFTLRCREATRLGVEAAVTVDDDAKRACLDFMTATVDWTPRPTVAQALTEYVAQRRALATSGTVADAIDRRTTDATRRGLSERHREDLELRLGKLKDAMGTRSLASVTPDCLKGWLASLGVGTATQRNYLKIAGSVFALAVEESRLAANPALKVKLGKVVSEEPGTLSAAALHSLLSKIHRRSLAAFAIQAFAGVRRAEVARLKWDDVKLGESVIVIGAQAAKTASRRLIPISPALRAWLALAPAQVGLVAPSAGTLRFDLDAARETAGIDDWPQNCLRHSCLSAWSATESDLTKVAGWAGNSPAIIHEHYRALWTAEQAQAWLGVAPPPEAGSKVIEFKTAS